MGRKASELLEDSQLSQGSATVVQQSVSYRNTLDGLMRSRRVAIGMSAQSASRRVLRRLLPRALDYDIENCMFTIVEQLVDMVQIEVPANLRQVLSRCAQHRQEVCEDDLLTDTYNGKRLLMELVNGAAIQSGWEGNRFLLVLQNLSRYLRWVVVAISL